MLGVCNGKNKWIWELHTHGDGIAIRNIMSFLFTLLGLPGEMAMTRREI